MRVTNITYITSCIAKVIMRIGNTAYLWFVIRGYIYCVVLTYKTLILILSKTGASYYDLY